MSSERQVEPVDVSAAFTGCVALFPFFFSGLQLVRNVLSIPLKSFQPLTFTCIY